MSDITVSGSFIEYPLSAGTYTDTDGDGAYDPQAYTGADPHLLLVTVYKFYQDAQKEQSLKLILGD